MGNDVRVVPGADRVSEAVAVVIETLGGLSVSRHCPTCTCTESSKRLMCGSVLLRGHEAFACMRDPDHEGDHEAGFYNVDGACEACGGLDLHSPECPTPERLEPPGTLTPLSWTDDDERAIHDEEHIGVHYRKDQWEFVYDAEAKSGEYRRRSVPASQGLDTEEGSHG